MLGHEWRYYRFKWRVNVENQKALRWNFMLQAISIVINNSTFFVIWLLFSQTLGVVNGWGMPQITGALSFGLLTIGCMDTIFGSVQSLKEMVPTGSFDALLTKPKNLYLRVISQDFTPSGTGDFLQGLIGTIVYCYWIKADWTDILCLLIMLPPSLVAMISFLYTCDCLIFWLPQTPIVSTALMDLMFLPLTQPISLVRGGLRFFYLIGVPVLLVGGLPVEAVTYHRYDLIALSYAISGAWLVFSLWIFKVSVRRYESGNVIG